MNHDTQSTLPQNRFSRLALKVSNASGRPLTFALAVLLIIGWAMLGPLFDFSMAWQLVINSFTTIVTFLMVFLIQNTQNRDTVAIHIKLDELIRVNHAARNGFMIAEDMDDEELERLRTELHRLGRSEWPERPRRNHVRRRRGRSASRKERKERKPDTD